jgi:hypothetical protein
MRGRIGASPADILQERRTEIVRRSRHCIPDGRRKTLPLCLTPQGGVMLQTGRAALTTRASAEPAISRKSDQ